MKDIYRFQQTEESGIYFSDPIIPVRIIHPDELAIVPKNYPLLCLSRGKKLESFIEHCLENGLDEYLQFILTVGVITDPTIIWNHLMEVQKLKPVIKPETWGYIEEFFREVPEAFESVPIIQRTIFDNIQQAKVQAHEEGIEKGREEGIEKGRAVGIEQGIKSGKLENQQTMLIPFLQRKFSNGDQDRLATLSRQIRQAENTEILDQWFDQIFDARLLDELAFSESTQDSSELEDSEGML